MTLQDKQLYVDSFLNERPKNGLDISHTRLLSALKLNDELANYFRDRAQIEDVYAKSIAKLTKKTYITNKSTLGTFLPLWEMLQMELSQLASIHGEYSSVISEHIEQPLRSSIQNNQHYADIHLADEHMLKLAREYEDLENKIQKNKKGQKAETFIKRQAQVLEEWRRDAPQFLQNHQAVDEFRWDNLKTTVYKFEALQQSHAEKMIEMTGKSMTTAANLRVDDELVAFCSSLASNRQGPPPPHHQQQPAFDPTTAEQLVNTTDNIVPEPSVSDMSLKSASSPAQQPPSGKKDKKRFFSSLVTMRRKPKSDNGQHHQLSDHPSDSKSSNRQRSVSNAGSSFVESASMHSINTHSTSDYPAINKSVSANNLGTHSHEAIVPNSPSSLNAPSSMRNAPSLNESISNNGNSAQPSLIMVDSEGYSIPPPDRTAWPGESNNSNSNSNSNSNNDLLLDTDDMGSDAGSMFSNPRIRVDIKSEAVNEEDASQSAVALSRVSTLLREKNSANAPTQRRLRGRREMRSTQLYSVIEQDQIVSKTDGSVGFAPPATQASSSSLLSNPFEINQEGITETPEEAEPVDELPSINVSITETIHAISRGGSVEKSVIWGEIGIQYTGPARSASPVCFQIHHQQPLDSIEATEYVQVLNNYGPQDSVYKINTQLYHQNHKQSSENVVCIRYQAPLDGHRLPLSVKPIWKCESDKSRLLVKYHKHANVPSLENVMLVASVTGDVQSALSIPAGELVLSQQRIKWDLGQISDINEAVIKAQLITLEEATPQPIAVRFQISDQLLTDVDVQPGNDSLVLWAKVNSTTKVVKTGKYIADA